MPFKKNALLFKNDYKLRIASVISDATIKEALQIVVNLVNEGFSAQQFSVSICNCPMACIPARTTVDKHLVPHIAETVSFLLPLVTDSLGRRNKKFHCDGKIYVHIIIDIKVFSTLTHASTRYFPYQTRKRLYLDSKINDNLTQLYI